MKIKSMNFRKNSANSKMLSIICDNMAEIYKSGLKINDAVRIIKDAVCDEAYKNSLECISCNLEKGKALSACFSEFRKLYPKLMTSMLRIGEESGALYFVLISLKFYYSKIFEIINKIKKSLSYPFIVFTAFVFMCIYVFKGVLPDIFSIYSDMGIKLSKQNEIIMEISRMADMDMTMLLLYFIIYVIVIPFIFFRFMAHKYFSGLVLYFPVFKLFYEYRIILILYIIFNSKINISKGLDMCQDCIDSEILNKAFKDINDNINKGHELSYSLEKCRMLSPYSLSIIKIHEESGSLEKAFFELSEKISRSMMEKINKYVKAVHPVLILVLTVMIGFFFINIIMPIIYGINGLAI